MTTTEDLPPVTSRPLTVETTDPPYMPHHQWEVTHPAAAAMEKAYDLQHRKRHEALSPDKPYTPTRRFPCRGTLRFTERTGPVWVVECDECATRFGIRREQIDREFMVAERVRHAKLPAGFRGVSIVEGEVGQVGARRALRVWLEHYHSPDRPRAPMLVGPSGRGKTLLVVSTAEVLCRRFLADVLYTTVTDLLNAVKNAIKHDASGDVLDRYAKVGVLVLDDLGADRDTDYAHEILRQVVDVRYRDGAPILGTTNVPPDQWPTVFGERTASRLLGLCEPVLVQGRDWRQELPPPPHKPPADSSEAREDAQPF